MNLIKTGMWIYVGITILHVPPVYYGQLCWIKMSESVKVWALPRMAIIIRTRFGGWSIQRRILIILYTVWCIACEEWQTSLKLDDKAIDLHATILWTWMNHLDENTILPNKNKHKNCHILKGVNKYDTITSAISMKVL